MPPITLLPTGEETLVVTTVVPECAPSRLFEYWTIPTLLCAWWPQQAEVEPRIGGAYRLSWPQMDWTLRGHYTEFAPGQRLAFTWAWDHDPAEAPPKLVTLAFAPATDAPDASRLTLTHGPYLATAAEQELRTDHHLAGWRHFLPALQRVASGG